MSKNSFFAIFGMLMAGFTTSFAQSWNNVGIEGFSAGDVGFNGIAIDKSGTPYVVYWDDGDSGKATVMKFNGLNWVSVGHEGFSAGVALTTSLALDSNGNPYVAFEDIAYNHRATVMRYFDGNWVTVGNPGFTPDTAQYTTIAIDRSGMPYVAFVAGGTTGIGPPSVMKFNGTAWVSVGNRGFSAAGATWPTIAIDTNGAPYVAYVDGSAGFKATVMKYNDTSWVPVGITGFSGDTALYPTIAFDRNNTPYIIYEDAANVHKATVEKFNGSSWTNIGSPGFSAGRVLFTNIAIDKAGTPFVVYQDAGNGSRATTMKYDGVNWVNVGAAGFSEGVANYTAIAIDSSGAPYVVYEDAHLFKATVMKFGTPTEVNGIGSNTEKSLTVFPNPTHGSLTIHLNSQTKGEVSITITNMFGEKVKDIKIPSKKETQVNLNVPKGVYFITAVTEDGIITEKIILD